MAEKKRTEEMAPADKQLQTLGLSKHDLEGDFEYNGTFVVGVLYPYEKNYVIKLISEQAGSISSLFIAEAEYVRKVCTLQVAIRKAPDWFPGASECLDTELITKLYEYHLELEASLQEKLKKNRERGRTTG